MISRRNAAEQQITTNNIMLLSERCEMLFLKMAKPSKKRIVISCELLFPK